MVAACNELRRRPVNIIMRCATLLVALGGATKFLQILPQGERLSTFAVAPAVSAAAQLTGISQSGLRSGKGTIKQQGKSMARNAGSTETASGPSLNVDLTGKVALVTGASRGIGAAIADKLAAAGATVIGTATSDSGAEAISARFTGDLKGKGMKLNVVNADEIKGVLKDIETEFGTPDILINNAGITKDGLMLRMKAADWDAVIDTNLNSIYRMTQGVLRGMTKKRWGRVISISSVVGSMGNAGQANYAAAKGGLEGFTRALAREVASRSITVNAVAPGFIESDMTAVLKDEWKAKLLESVPVGRLGTPEEIAEAVLFLAAPSSAYVTGQTLHVNGGMYM
jgi:3-oxoacyl-[acyl-carrier protein] reductase